MWLLTLVNFAYVLSTGYFPFLVGDGKDSERNKGFRPVRRRSQIYLVSVTRPTHFLLQSSSRRIGVYKNWKITEGQLYSFHSLVGNWNWLNFDLRQFQKLNQSQISFSFKFDVLCDGGQQLQNRESRLLIWGEMVSMFFSETCYCKYLKLVFVVQKRAWK